MMVLQVTNNTGGTVQIGRAGIPDGQSKVFPADRCSWTETYDEVDNQYEITIAEFWPGAVEGSINVNQAISLNGTNRVVRLGYIGKSGRFVPITGTPS